MKQDIQKTAALAMLSPADGESLRLAEDVSEILALTAQLADAPLLTETMENAVPVERLRSDTAAEADTERRCIRLSKNEKEGFVRVARTVG